jgi:hypothetical protein
MELVKARGLNQIVRDEGPLPPERVASIGVQLLNALGVAHASGIFHRDVKPSNVLVAETGRVVLADFGIASVQGDPAMTRSGLILGSPSYIAPERARGLPAGPASDLWAVGATLYTAVEGRPPYDRDGIVPILTAAAMEDPDPYVKAGPLAPVLSALLQREPEKRPPIDEARLKLREIALMGPPTAPERPKPSPKKTAVLPAVETPAPRTSPEEEAAAPVSPAAAAAPTSGAGAAAPVSGAGAAPASGAAAVAPTSPAAAGPVAPAEPVDAVETPAEEAKPTSPAAVRDEAVDDIAFISEPISPAAPSSPPSAGAATAEPPAPPKQPRRASVPMQEPRTYHSGRNRTYALVAAILAAVVLLAIVVVALVNRNSSDSGNAPQAGSSPSAATPSAAPRTSASASPSAPSSPTAAAPSKSTAPTGGATTVNTAIPAGWHRYTDPSGFSIGVPNADGWQVQSRSDGIAIQNFQGPFLLIQQASPPNNSDPVADWQNKEGARQNSSADYQRVSISKVTYRGWNTADWIFTFDKGGTKREVLNRGFITTPGQQAYGLYWEVNASQYQASLAMFQTFANTFQPAPRG